MEISYWKARWEKGYTGWHMDKVYPNLPDFWPKLHPSTGDTVMVPLCGKSLDLLWLAAQKHKVIGIEVSQKAIEQFFREHEIDFQESTKGPFKIYRSQNLEIWAGDFFKMKPHYLPEIDFIYDKAALIALPLKKRKKYTEAIMNFCKTNTQILLNAFEYEQEEMNGPPFAVFSDEIEMLYGQRFKVLLLREESVFDKLPKFRSRGLSSYLVEKLYHLKPD